MKRPRRSGMGYINTRRGVGVRWAGLAFREECSGGRRLSRVGEEISVLLFLRWGGCRCFFGQACRDWPRRPPKNRRPKREAARTRLRLRQPRFFIRFTPQFFGSVQAETPTALCATGVTSWRIYDGFQTDSGRAKKLWLLTLSLWRCQESGSRGGKRSAAV